MVGRGLVAAWARSQNLDAELVHHVLPVLFGGEDHRSWLAPLSTAGGSWKQDARQERGCESPGWIDAQQSDSHGEP